ncbi:putative transcription factor AS2-LOB family [Helianthus annuus]|uniref:Putative LOB domain-containing protein n=1 Tax=Helianthus annuus TaxID=4232 RepID=A0A251SBI2_HELAN|nr:LOB domain-containing protein 36 [Helianthus annuus]KAF5766260.1 putative transcription factor AS2-LOB family [Helianthus annuus]KAJ0452687.1 putative transcription factor AS2-LOB family [Helianthus annuus]KAJ0457654.1 putative transcription factor AS2-LOB family [Helianthus annuus]KAJ0474594.1 putative transcription factor AS2-LOB family [Helianthus annuus]KAJ0650151.1 putative transcription factor AS2-LOB family [Helianthus annuus]
MSSSNSPCAACKFLRRKCTQECVFAPYFPPDQPQKFANVHKVFGASNVAKILNELSAAQREDAVNSLAYEAEARLRDPVYGCVGFISILQQRLKQIQNDIHTAKQELAGYVGPSAMMPVLNQGYMQQFPNLQPSLGPVMQSNMQPMLSLHGPGGTQEARSNQPLYEAQQQQLVEAAREQEMLRTLEHQQQMQQQPSMDLMRFNRGYDGAGPSGQVTHSGFTQLNGQAAAMSPGLALGGSYESNVYQIQQPQQEQHQQRLNLMPQQLLVQQQTQPQPNHGDGSEEGP